MVYPDEIYLEPTDLKPEMIHLDGECRTCGRRWGGTFSKEGIKRKIRAHETGIRPVGDRPIMLDCGHPLGWTEKDYRAVLNLFDAAARLVDEKKRSEADE